MHPLYANDCKKGLEKLLAWAGGNKTQLAKVCGVTRNTVSFWFSKGYIGRDSAAVVGSNPNIPITKEELRPDIKHWDHYKFCRGRD